MLASRVVINSLLRRNVFLHSEPHYDGSTMTITEQSDIQEYGLIRKQALAKNIDTIVVSGDNITALYSFENIDTLKTFKITATQVTELPDNCFKNCLKLETVELSDKITKIGENCFIYTNISSIDLKNVIEIDGNAFSYCYNLHHIKLNQSKFGYESFSNSGIKDVEFGSGVTQFAIAIFRNCLNLETITIPSQITEISPYSFQSCSKLTTVKFADQSKLQLIGEGAFEYTNITELYSFENIDTLKTIKITATKVTEIPENCFKNCRKLATVELSENIIKLGNSCFEGTNLTTIDLSHIQTIGEFAFRYCHSLDKIKLNQSELGAGLFMDTGLTEVELGSGVTQIPTGCFMYCANLQTITIPNTVQVIGERAFVYCTKLTKVNFADKSTLQQIGDAAFGNTNISEIALPRSLKQIGDNAFEHVLFADLKLENFDALTVGKEAFAHNELLKTVTIGDNVTLTNGAFKGCNILETVTFGSKKVRLDDNLFYECFKLKEVKGTFETVGQATFYRCSSLEKFNLVNVSSIGGEAFWLCAKLEVDFPNQTMSIGDSAFAYCDNVVIKTIYQGYTIGSSAFMGCLGITELKFYSSNFGAQAFEGCEKLKSVDLTAIEGSYAVPNNAFAYCFALETLKINDKLTQIGNLAFYKTKVTGEIELFSTVIGSFAFGETLITKLTLSSVPQMGSAPFMNCKHLKTLVLNSTDRDSLSLSPFIGCEQLYDYNIKSAKDLSHDNGVFFDSMKLTLYAFGSKATEFELPPLVMKISADAFVLSRQLKTVNISHYVELPAGLFENCLNLTTFNYTANDNKLKNSLPARLLFNCTNLKKVVLSTQITELGEYCFAKCTSLTDIDLSNVIKIGGNCFVACTALTSVKIDNVEELGEYAFSDTGLKSVVYPPKLISVVSNVFNNAKKLSKVTFGKNLMTLDAGCFAYSGISKLTIPATVMSVDPTVFDNADVSLKVEKNSVFFTVSGNCLIDKYSGNLVLTFGKLSKTYTIPKDVKKIGANSIRPWIEAATVGKTTLYQKSIGTTVIKIPASVVSIDPTAFNADTYLYTVCYDGFVYSQSSPEASNPILTNAYVTDKYPYGDLLGKAALKSCSTKVPGELNARHIIGLSVAEIVLIVIVVFLIILFVVGFIIIRMKLPKAGDKTVFQPIS